MRTFRYKARSSFGADVDGVTEANTQDEAVILLKDEGYIVTTIEEVTGDIDIDLRVGNKKTKDKTLAIM